MIVLRILMALGLAVVLLVVLASMLVVFMGCGYALGYAWFDNGEAGAVVGAIVMVAYLVIKCREPITNLRHAIPAAIRHLVLQRDEYCCQRCGTTRHLQIDHIRPVALGGDNEVSNLQVLCEHCNKSKGARYIG